MRHPLIGPLTVTQQTPSTGTRPSIVVATASHGSPSHTALALLAQATAPIPPYLPVNRVSTT